VTVTDVKDMIEKKLVRGGLLNASVDVLTDDPNYPFPTLYISGKSLDLTVNVYNSSSGFTINFYSFQPIIQMKCSLQCSHSDVVLEGG